MRIYLIGCMPEGKNSDLEERIMKILLAAVNAKYIHSNLAVYSLKAYAEDPAVEIGEYTINQQKDDILMDIYKRQCIIFGLSTNGATRSGAPGEGIWSTMPGACESSANVRTWPVEGSISP